MSDRDTDDIQLLKYLHVDEAFHLANTAIAAVDIVTSVLKWCVVPTELVTELLAVTSTRVLFSGMS